MAVLAYRFKRDSRPSRSAILDRCSVQQPDKSCPEGTSESTLLMGNEPHSSSGISTLESHWTKQNRITLNTRHAEIHKSQYKVLTRHIHLTKDYQRTMFWVTAKG
jgi:hypothetical protein